MISSSTKTAVIRSSRCISITSTTRSISSHSKYAYIALGSNIGNRIDNIENACKALERSGLPILRTSHLYETKPMYVEAQGNFINGVCEVSVEENVSSMELLAKLKHIEDSMGRVKIIDKGPRNIDLDILLHGDQSMDTEILSIPHKAMLEREFVLRPLCDIIPDGIHPRYPTTTYVSHLKVLDKDSSMSTITPFGKHGILKSLDSARQTQLMSIVNITPDSFSDGGKLSPDPNQVLPTIHKQIQDGADIIDIGGYSTRPNASIVSTEEEMARVVPIIQATRKNFPDISISVDTFRHEVAEAAISSGADIVNDVSAGTLDDKMLPTVARLGCTYIAMHMRGNPSTMTRLNHYPNGVLRGIAEELLTRIESAEKEGVRKWRMILDPGIGFAKDLGQNLEILRRFTELRQWSGLEGFPWLVGTSKKAFIGRITGVQHAQERIWGTAATICTAIQGGADIVRVHDVKEMRQVTKMADAIWRL